MVDSQKPSDRVRELRLSTKNPATGKPLSQAEFAKTIGISQVALSNIERGTAEPSKKVISRILDIYKVNISGWGDSLEVQELRERLARSQEEIEKIRARLDTIQIQCAVFQHMASEDREKVYQARRAEEARLRDEERAILQQIAEEQIRLDPGSEDAKLTMAGHTAKLDLVQKLLAQIDRDWSTPSKGE